MERYNGVAQQLTTEGLPFVSVSYPQIRVWLTGTTTLAAIYSDDGITPLTNPFQGDAHGVFGFSAANGMYDVRVENGPNTLPLCSPYTIPEVFLGTGGEDLRFLTGALGSLPAAGNIGTARLLINSSRSVVVDQGTQWFSLTGNVYNVQAFGATGNGFTDDTVAVQAALTAILTQAAAGVAQAVLYFPAGVYALSQTLAFGDGAAGNVPLALSIIGDGEELTILKKTSAGDCLHGTYLNFYDGAVLIRDLTITTTVAQDASSAISLEWDNALSSVFQVTADISRVTIRPDAFTTANHIWGHGIRLFNAWMASLRDVQITGDFNQVNPPPSVGYGVTLLGNCVDISISNVKVSNVDIGFYIGAGATQGVRMDKCFGVTVHYGIFTVPGTVTPELDVEACHFSAWDAGIVIDNMPQSRVSGCLIYKYPASTSVSWVGIVVRNNAIKTRLIGNHIEVLLQTGVTDNGIVIQANQCILSANCVSGNTGNADKVSAAVAIFPGVDSVIVTGNMALYCASNIFAAGATNVILAANLP